MTARLIPRRRRITVTSGDGREGSKAEQYLKHDVEKGKQDTMKPEALYNSRIEYDKICMMTTRLACNRAIESSYWRMDDNSDVGLLTGYVLYRLPVELEFMDLDTFPR
jgi:hypothetical protein